MARTPDEQDAFEDRLKELNELVEVSHTPTVDPWGRTPPDKPTKKKKTPESEEPPS